MSSSPSQHLIPSAPAFFSWLGVTAYLTREANLKKLRAIATRGAPGSELVFNYLEQRIFDATDEDTQRLRASFASLGEPWVSGFVAVS
jgi:O-methyltransferase involved in polyketide biosynthesis